VFNILGTRVVEAQVLDLFAGSGAYGCDALSRGASLAVFVDQDAAAAKIIGQNLQKAKFTNGTVLAAKWQNALQMLAGRRFDVIFADPPYAKKAEDSEFLPEMLQNTVLPDLLAPEGLLICEAYAKGRKMPKLPAPWIEKDRREYGDTVLLFFAKA
jgi:16S rRNA (guanine966-N2)-methyltransferase